MQTTPSMPSCRVRGIGVAVIVGDAQGDRVVTGRRVRMLWILDGRGGTITEIPVPASHGPVLVRARVREVDRQIGG